METLAYLRLKETIQDTFDKQKEQAIRLRSSNAEERLVKLKKLKEWILTHKDAIREALYQDFRKPAAEVDMTEIYVVLAEINHALKDLKKWMKDEPVSTPLSLLGTSSYVQYEPKGVCLIIAPWNYPFNLMVGPLVSAIAAGNTAILKPSEMTPHTARLLVQMVGDLFYPAEVAIFEGEVEVSTMLLNLPFDHIFFTGSPQVGKIVMRAAAEHLTSVTLELGGKSPAIIDASANIADAAGKIVYGKFVNCGQTCIAPDYLLVHESKIAPLIDAMKEQIDKMYNADDKGIHASADYARIVNEKHFDRLNEMLNDVQAKGGQVIKGGMVNRADRYMEPTLVLNPSDDSQIMQEEIFGPILPIKTYQNIQEAIDLINQKPKPLALYVFSQEKECSQEVLEKTSAGGALINDCVLHFLHPELPFGGVNNSGIGKAHGYFGFKAFSNEKGVMKQRTGLTATKLLHPPYGAKAKRIIDTMIKYL
ncbi:aldehyde dehydrogenase family protein [Penaeicola halotolerans]|uniref:aldehyde dehydrogenase family protein n=1 Tax=Penaeicola halotolerans TaxID=2793196 RepID=UPI001CF8D17A|nr:aldehyde dehydrogenase family protein [Penaeicola halotolerans]